MARSVMAATSALMPTASASSSMHSCSIMVESMSATRTSFLRFSVGTRAASTALLPMMARAAATGSAALGRLDVAGDALVQPVDLATGLVLDRRDQGGVERRVGGICDEAENRHWMHVVRLEMMGVSPGKRAVLIAGPTASGKSALALTMAREQGGVIVNTDALQVYDVLRLITARPSAIEMDAGAAPAVRRGAASGAVFDRGLGAGGDGRDRRSGRAGADLYAAGPGSISRRCSTGFAGCAGGAGRDRARGGGRGRRGSTARRAAR